MLRRPFESAQYTSLAFGQRCREAGVRPSMGSVGDCFDNARCESFFATLECELLDRGRFKTQVEARMAVFEFIEGWYNPHRRHSALDYLSPINYERIQQTESLTASPTPSTKAGQLQIVRSPGLEATMSRYLVERIAALANVELVIDSEVVLLEGEDGVLAAARWRHRRSGKETRRNIRHMFLFIGAEPNTSWLSHCDVVLDQKGFVRTGTELGINRPALATSRSGVFAVGDVRAGSVKRLAAAVGEGAQVVAAITPIWPRQTISLSRKGSDLSDNAEPLPEAE